MVDVAAVSDPHFFKAQEHARDSWVIDRYPLVICCSLLLKMVIYRGYTH